MQIDNKPKVSVILPFYNASATIGMAIESIFKQTYTNFECVLVNNNSTDASRNIASDWAQKDRRFILIDEPKQGVVFASNSGAAIAQGEYVARMDADDISLPNRLALQTNFLEEHPEYGVVSGQVEYTSHSDKTDGFRRYVKWVNSIQTHNEIQLNRFIESPIVNPTAMWRKSVGEVQGLYRNGNFPEDYEMWLRWLDAGILMHKIAEVILQWVDSDTRLTRTNEVYSNEAFYRIKSEYLSKWLAQSNVNGLKYAVWGASKLSRTHASYLEKQGIVIDFFIDIIDDRQIVSETLYYKNLPNAGVYFILVYIKHHTIRGEVQSFLISKNYIEGKDFLFVS